MTQPIRFTVITDDPFRAACVMFGGADDVPPFVRIISKPEDIIALPKGTLCFGRWFSAGSPAERAFEAMHWRGMLAFADSAFFDRLYAWLARRDEARARRAQGVDSAPDEQPENPAPPAEAQHPQARRKAGWK